MNETKQRINEEIQKHREELEKKNPLELIKREYEECVKNVKLSDETKALMICKAKLSDLYSSLSDIHYRSFYADLPKEVEDGWCNLDKAITQMIADNIDYMLNNEKYLIM